MFPTDLTKCQIALCGPKFNTISKQYVYFWPKEGPRKTELPISSSGALAWKESKCAGVLASQKHPGHFGREQAEVRALIFMLNPHLASEMLKINFHLHLIFLFVIATIVCLNKEVARASLRSSQSSSQSPDWRDTDVNEQGGQAGTSATGNGKASPGLSGPTLLCQHPPGLWEKDLGVAWAPAPPQLDIRVRAPI